MRVHHDMVPQTGRAAKLAETRAANANAVGAVKQEDDANESGLGNELDEAGTQDAALGLDEWSDSDGIPESYESRWPPSSSSTGATSGLTDGDLGIKRRKLDPTIQPGDVEYLVFEEEIWEADMDLSLATARREWIRRAREKRRAERIDGAPERRRKDIPQLPPVAGDALDAQDESKRGARRSDSKSLPPSSDHASALKASAYARKRYLVEKAKLRVARQQNAKLNEVAVELGQEFRQTREDRDNALKAALIREMG